MTLRRWLPTPAPAGTGPWLLVRWTGPAIALVVLIGAAFYFDDLVLVEISSWLIFGMLTLSLALVFIPLTMLHTAAARSCGTVPFRAIVVSCAISAWGLLVSA